MIREKCLDDGLEKKCLDDGWASIMLEYTRF